MYFAEMFRSCTILKHISAINISQVLKNLVPDTEGQMLTELQNTCLYLCIHFYLFIYEYFE